jgi:mannose-1-phosphate guanylyltransferase/phosphomannomutase
VASSSPDAAGLVTRFQEKPPAHEVFTNRANAGVYVLEPSILRHVPADRPFDFARDLFPKLLDLGIIYACPFTGYLQDTGTVAAYRQANWDVLEGRLGGTGPVVLAAGAGAEIAATARLTGRNVVGNGCVVAGNARLEESILWDNCRVGPGARIFGAVLGTNVSVGAGAVVGDGAILADDATVEAGARVPEGARAAPGETIRKTASS